MKKEHFEFDQNWYDLWMQQTKDFLTISNQNLKDLFEENATVNPEEHMKKIQQWLDKLKDHWQFMQLNEQQRMFEKYWLWMIKMCNDASDLMLQEWIKRYKEKQPVRNIEELYSLWLKSCSDVYNRAMNTQAYQETYGEFMNAALNLWKTTVNKK